MPKDTESYRRLPKADLKIEYRPIVSGVVANLELGERLGVWEQSPQRGPGLVGGSGGEAPLKLKAFFAFKYPKLSFIGGSSAAGSPRVESLVETFASFGGTHAQGVEGNIYI